jgi:nucleotide-binding universal stress UspA family protein
LAKGLHLKGGMARPSFRRILVPFDFSEPAARALRIAADLAPEHDGRLLVLHAIASFYPMTELAVGEAAVWTPPTELVSRTRDELARAVRQTLGRAARPVTECRVVLGDPFDRIMQAAEKVDLIVMATQGRTGLSHLVIGSVAEKVVRHAPVPVLTVGPARRTKRRG